MPLVTVIIFLIFFLMMLFLLFMMILFIVMMILFIMVIMLYVNVQIKIKKSLAISVLVLSEANINIFFWDRWNETNRLNETVRCVIYIDDDKILENSSRFFPTFYQVLCLTELRFNVHQCHCWFEQLFFSRNSSWTIETTLILIQPAILTLEHNQHSMPTGFARVRFDSNPKFEYRLFSSVDRSVLWSFFHDYSLRQSPWFCIRIKIISNLSHAIFLFHFIFCSTTRHIRRTSSSISSST